LHPFYCERFGTGPKLCPVAEAEYKRIVSLPMFPAMSDADVQKIVTAMHQTFEEMH
jgi:perosamine synthetase